MAWLIDDIDLSTFAFNISNRSAGWSVPARRGSNLTIPGRHGTQWVANKPFDEGSTTLSMWALGANEDGSMPDDGNLRRMCRFNLDKLTAIFGQTSRLLNVVQVESAAYGGKNMVANPSFEAAQSVNQFTYQNSILNPAGRGTSSQTLLTNIFPNPNMVGLIGSPTWYQKSDNLVLDPDFLYQRDAGDIIGTSNYIWPNSFESTASGTPDHWVADTNVTLAVANATSTDQAQMPYGGTKVLRATTTASVPADTYVANRPDSFYVGQGHFPGVSFYLRRSANSATGTRNIKVRIFNYNETDQSRYNYSSYQVFNVPDSTTSWTRVEFVPTGGTWGTTGSDSDHIGLQIATNETWASGTAVCFDQFCVNLVNQSNTANSWYQPTSYWANKPGPFFNTNSAWGNLDGSASEGALTRWWVNPDTRWVPDASTTASGPYYTFADRPGSSTVLNFIAMGLSGGQTTGFTAPLAAPTVGQAYVLRFQARAAAGAACVVKLLKQGTSDSSPVTVASVSLTGSGTPVANGSRMSGTIYDYESAAYTAQTGDQLWVRVEMPSRTDGFPVFQFSRLVVGSGQPIYFDGDTADTAWLNYSWSGTQYNSRSIQQQQRVNRIASNSSQGAFSRTVNGAAVAVAQAVANYDNQPTQLATDSLPIGTQQGLWVTADLWGTFSNAARPTAGTTITAQLVLEILSSGGSTLLTTTSASAVLGQPGFPNRFTLRVAPDDIPAGAVNYRVTAKLVKPIAGQYLELVDLLVSPFGVDPTLIGAPSYFDGGTSGASWTSTANNSNSVWKTALPSNWSVSSGLLAGGSGITGISPVMHTSPAQVVLNTPLGSAASAGPYLVGLNLTPQCLSAAGVPLSSGDVSVVIQAIASNGSVAGTASAGAVCADSSVTDLPQYLQGLLTTAGSFTSLAFWFIASTGVTLLKVSIAQAYLMPVSGSYTNPNQRLDFNALYNPQLVAGSKGWRTSGTSVVSTAQGNGLRFTGSGKAWTDPVFAGSLTTMEPVAWGGVGFSGAAPLSVAARTGTVRKNLAIDPSFTGSANHSAGAGATLTFGDSGWSKYGSGSLKIVTGGNAGACAYVERTNVDAVWASAGHTYTISAYWHTEDPNCFPHIGIYVLNSASSSSIIANSPSAVGSDGDGRLSVTFTLPHGSDFASASVLLYNGSTTAGDTIWWDGLLIEDVTTANVLVANTNAYPDPSHEYGLGPFSPAAPSGSGVVTLDQAQKRSGKQSLKFTNTATVTTSNLMPYPSFETDANADGIADGWTTAAFLNMSSETYTTPATFVPGGTGKCQRVQYTRADGNAYRRLQAARFAIPTGLTDGLYFRFDYIFASGNPADLLSFTGYFYDAANNNLGTFNSTGVNVPNLPVTSIPSVGTMHILNSQIPAGTTQLIVWFDTVRTGADYTGVPVDYSVDRLAISTIPLASYFDGSTPSDNVFVRSWDGAANASTSSQVGPGIEVDRNLAPVPYWSTVQDGSGRVPWSIYDSTGNTDTIGAGDVYQGRTSIRVTAGTGSNRLSVRTTTSYAANQPNLLAGHTYWFTADLYVSANAVGNTFNIIARDDQNNDSGAATLSNYTVNGVLGSTTVKGGWVRVGVKISVDPGRTITGIYLTGATGAQPVGAYMQTTRWRITETTPDSTTPPTSAYFDGLTPHNGVDGYFSTGTVGLSTTVRVSRATDVVSKSGTITGTPATYGAGAGDLMTFSAWVYVPPGADPYGVNDYVIGMYGTAPGSAKYASVSAVRGSFVQVVATFPVVDPNGTLLPRIFCPTYSGDSIWIDDFGLTKGSTPVDFSGDTISAPGSGCRWAGTPGASVSQRFTEPLLDYFDGDFADFAGTDIIGWEGTANHSVSDAFAYTEAIIGSVATAASGQLFGSLTLPVGITHIALSFSGDGATVTSAYLAPSSGADVDQYQVAYDFFPYFDGSSDSGPMGEKTAWSGTPDASVSQAIPSYPTGWVKPTSPVTLTPHQVTQSAIGPAILPFLLPALVQ